LDLEQWLTSCKHLHEKAKRVTLAGPEARDYRVRRDELTRAMLAAQDLLRPSGQQQRRSLRVARAIQVEVERRGHRERLTTFDISTGGFSAPMASAPLPGEVLTATLRLPGGEPLVAPAKVVGSIARSGNVRVSFAFAGLSAKAHEQLEFAIFDMVLVQFGK
jgi:hypothetical protein